MPRYESATVAPLLSDSLASVIVSTLSMKVTDRQGRVFLTIEYDAAHHWLCNKWQGYQTYETTVQGSNACLAWLAKHHSPYLVNDMRQVVGLWDQAEQWLLTQWIPRAVQLGLTHIAQVISPETLASASAELIQQGSGELVTMRLFLSRKEAEAWLQQAQLGSAAPRL
ncbi:hypothetical protein [Hymenobacter sp. BT730]|uniref:hypothetical protein n=1 Tax=Hymenobacter sp. BT730 TaxID=3063332 RepID=UPI0026DF0FF8|nr:hypothetical protein [Hymenobacter sp. BT730]